MQVEIEIKPKVYEPKTLKITFETEEEAYLFKRMLSWNVSVPKLAFKSEPDKAEKLEQLMQQIHDNMSF